METFTHVIINGESTRALTIRPTGDGKYAPVKWEDQNGNNVAMIVVHEETGSGTPHRHLSIYTCGADRSTRLSVIDIDYGTDDRRCTFEDLRVIIGVGAEFILRAPNGSYYTLKVDNNGVLTTESADGSRQG